MPEMLIRHGLANLSANANFNICQLLFLNVHQKKPSAFLIEFLLEINSYDWLLVMVTGK
jgi:hypothetical protein